MKKYLCLIGVLGVLLCNTANSYAQKVAVKTNLLYDATTTMNLGLEIGLGKKWSLDLSGNYNPWKFDDETRLRHWGVQPELRYWLCEKFNGHFLGLHGHYAKYNVGGMSFLSDNMEHHRYQGHLWGGADLVVGIGDAAYRQENDHKDRTQQQRVKNGFACHLIDKGAQCKRGQRKQNAPCCGAGQKIIQQLRHCQPPFSCGRSGPAWSCLHSPSPAQ